MTKGGRCQVSQVVQISFILLGLSSANISCTRYINNGHHLDEGPQTDAGPFSDAAISDAALSDATLPDAPPSTIDARPDTRPDADPLANSVSFFVGSFIKSTTTGLQTVNYNLSAAPKALILWSNDHAESTSITGVEFHLALGFTDQTGQGKCASAAAKDASNPTNASRRQSNTSFSFVEWGETTVASANFSTWNTSQFALNWTTNNKIPSIIEYLALGGGSNIRTKVVSWPMATAPGLHSVTGVGFRPDVVLHLHNGADFLGPPPANAAHGVFGLGAMDNQGGQWANSFFSLDNVSSAGTSRGQQIDAGLYAFDQNKIVTQKAVFSSFDPDGFTLNFLTATPSAGTVISLAIANVQAVASSFTQPTSTTIPVAQTITGVGFKPGALFFSAYSATAQSAPIDTSRFAIGAADGAHEVSAFITDAWYTSIYESNWTGARTDKCLNFTCGVPEDPYPKYIALANMTGFTSDGFNLSWTLTDGASRQILFLGLAEKGK